MSEKFSEFDPAEYLDSDEAIQVFMAAACETADADYIAHALGVAVRAKGLAGVAKKLGSTEQELHSLLNGNVSPSFAAIVDVMRAVGLDLSVVASQQPSRQNGDAG